MRKPMTTRQFIQLLTALMAIVLIIAGCQSSEVSKGLPDGEFKMSYGTLILKEGRYTLSEPGEVIEVGSYIVDGDKITFHVDTTSSLTKGYCGKDTTFIYQWSFDSKNGQLTFKVIDDACKVRTSFFGSFFEFQK